MNYVFLKIYAHESTERIKTIVKIEQPIHFEELCRRMAPLYGRQKATSVVRYEINSLLASLKISLRLMTILYVLMILKFNSTNS